MSRAKKTGQVVPPSGDGLSHQSSGASSDALRLDRKRRDSLRPDPTALTLRLMKVQAGLERLRLVPLEGLLKAHGMLSDLQAVEYGVSDMPKFALFSYRQVCHAHRQCQATAPFTMPRGALRCRDGTRHPASLSERRALRVRDCNGARVHARLARIPIVMRMGCVVWWRAKRNNAYK
ncbi:hypothetical protein T492DRAFT_1130195 [Pavlovales sp. CCMP2436]|nr:hypothetical protein T492DRAFT_1130195 [Pavlovales sp. CCMP2436]